MNNEEGYIEVITGKQFLEAMMGQEVHGVSVGVAYPVVKRECMPGEELSKHRVRVSFEFDVTCNSEPVANLSYDEGGAMSMALLKSFLVADKDKLLHLMVDTIGTQLGMHSCETFMHEFLPQVDINSRKLFKPAIEVLEGDEKRYWHEQEEETDNGLADWFDYCVEEIFECFKAKFVNSNYELIGE